MSWRAGLCVLVVLSLGGAPAAVAAEPTPPAPGPPQGPSIPCRSWAKGERFLVDLHEAPLGDVARIVSCATDKNVMFAPATLASKTVTVISARPIDRRQLTGLWRALLAEHQLVSERRGAYQLVRPVRR